MATTDRIVDIRIIPMYDTQGSSKPVGVIIIKTVQKFII